MQSLAGRISVLHCKRCVFAGSTARLAVASVIVDGTLMPTGFVKVGIIVGILEAGASAFFPDGLPRGWVMPRYRVPRELVCAGFGTSVVFVSVANEVLVVISNKIIIVVKVVHEPAGAAGPGCMDGRPWRNGFTMSYRGRPWPSYVLPTASSVSVLTAVRSS